MTSQYAFDFCYVDNISSRHAKSTFFFQVIEFCTNWIVGNEANFDLFIFIFFFIFIYFFFFFALTWGCLRIFIIREVKWTIKMRKLPKVTINRIQNVKINFIPYMNSKTWFCLFSLFVCLFVYSCLSNCSAIWQLSLSTVITCDRAANFGLCLAFLTVHLQTTGAVTRDLRF
jgi:hypothetical protein